MIAREELSMVNKSLVFDIYTYLGESPVLRSPTAGLLVPEDE
jgi:hypothetical protein